MLLNITSLDDLHIYGNMLADKKSDKQLLEEVDEVTGSLAEKNADQDLEKHSVLKTPYLHAGNTISAFRPTETSLGTTRHIYSSSNTCKILPQYRTAVSKAL